MNIGSYIKKLIMVIEERNNIVVATCPTITPDYSERGEWHKKIANFQKEINAVVSDIRAITGNNFSSFSDEELIIACYLWASVWTTAPNLDCSSREFGDIIGRNRTSRLQTLIGNLLHKKSALSNYVSLQWQNRSRTPGVYMFLITKPEDFGILFLNVNKDS